MHLTKACGQLELQYRLSKHNGDDARVGKVNPLSQQQILSREYALAPFGNIYMYLSQPLPGQSKIL